MVLISEVKSNIEAVFRRSPYSTEGWAAIRRAALIPCGKQSCSPWAEKRLWLAAALRRSKPQNQPITSAEVTAKLLECRGDLRAAIPGFVSIPDVKALPGQVQGWELPAIVQSYTGYLPDDNRLRDWCVALGYSFTTKQGEIRVGFSRRATYSASQVGGLIRHWVALRVAERERSRKQAQKNFHQVA